MLVGRVLEASKIRTIRISAGDIESKWPGDAERNVRDIFSLAKKLAPAVVWIDEADDLFAVRSSSNPSDSITRGYKVEFMVGMDGVLNGKGPEDRVMVICTTNRIWDIDPAVLRRVGGGGGLRLGWVGWRAGGWC